jgi:hypothetical protein
MWCVVSSYCNEFHDFRSILPRLIVITISILFFLQVIDNQHLHAVCDVIVQSGRSYADRRHYSTPTLPCPLMYAYYDTEYLGKKNISISSSIRPRSLQSIIQRFPLEFRKLVSTNLFMTCVPPA